MNGETPQRDDPQGHQDCKVGEYKGKEGANSRFTDGLYINTFVVPPIRLVKGSFIFELYRQNRKLLSRQELENLPADKSPFWTEPVTRHTHVIVLSYGWLSKDHPDPEGFHLSRLGPLLKSFHDSQMKKTTEMKNKRYEGDVAVFMDYVSLLQDPQGFGRETWQYHVFQQSLDQMTWFYANGRTRVWCMTKMPTKNGDIEHRPYERRGWCHFEKSIASIASGSKRLLDMGSPQLSEEGLEVYRKICWQDLASGEELDFDEHIEKRAKVFRRPPIFPETFRSDLKNVDCFTFTAGHDRERVCKLYETTFSNIVHEVDRLEFVGLEWGYDEAVEVAAFLPKCKRLQRVNLRGNRITDDGARLLIKSIPHTLRFLDLRDNGLNFEFEDDPTDGEIWNSSMPIERKQLREEWRKCYFEALRSFYGSSQPQWHWFLSDRSARRKIIWMILMIPFFLGIARPQVLKTVVCGRVNNSRCCQQLIGNAAYR